MQRAFLAVTAPGAPPRRFAIGAVDPVTVGRHPDNAIVIGDPQASRFHCVITRTPEGGFAVQDLQSRNGTRLNGQPVTLSPLKPGDVVAIGQTELALGLGAVPGAMAAQPPAAPRPAAAPAALEAPPAAPPPRAGLLDDVVDLRPVHEAPDDIPIEQYLAPGAEPDIGFDVASTAADDEKFLPVLAESLPEKEFPAEEIALIDARGQIVHAAASGEPHRQSLVAGSGEAVSALRQILLICNRTRATDIHLEPKNDNFALRLRIDGRMVDVVRVSKPMGIRLSSLAKVLSHIDMQFKNTIQEGHFGAAVPGRRIDCRVSFAPAIFGQKLVVRILDAAGAPRHLGELLMPSQMLEQVRRVSSGDAGMILVCGPTGSGKTTTLYAALRDVGTAQRNVVTIEDPVEMQIEGATQIPVDESHGNSFASLLRSILRQDPDVIMVGEIRDPETAKIAMQAAMTGHLVLSTAHARDTISALFRLMDLGSEPYLVASSIQIIVSQRLVRLLCQYCKKPVPLTKPQLERMGPMAERVRQIFVPGACPKCLKTGFAGRRAIYEMLVVNDAVRERIQKSPTPQDIEAALASTDFRRLSHAGYQLVIRGLTAFDEIEHVVQR